jgi:hypothetical protein
MFTTPAFTSPTGFRQAIYAGNIFRLAATHATRALITDVRQGLERDFGAPLERLHERYGFADMREKMTALRATLTTDARYLDALGAITNIAGAPAELAYDPLRLRCVLPGNHLNRGADIAYAAHRDTWYGNPQAQINFWIPLQDVTPETSFMFHPQLFNVAVPNNSAAFSYNDWSEKRGWQGNKAEVAVTFPAPTSEIAGGQAFGARAGEIIAFSAAQLHQTVKNVSRMTRFSLDFRTVHIGDHAAGLGAPNADNASKAEAFRDYLFPKGKAA